MGSSIGPMFLGLICILIGIFNSKGDISTLHSYHRKRVADEDRLPLGKKVGLGMIIIGISLIIFGGLSLVTELLEIEIFRIMGCVLLIVGMAIGLVISLSAIIKYNKGLFWKTTIINIVSKYVGVRTHRSKIQRGSNLCSLSRKKSRVSGFFFLYFSLFILRFFLTYTCAFPDKR